MSSLLVAEMARFKKPLYTHYKIHSFLIAEIASCKKIFSHSFWKSPVLQIYSLLVAGIAFCKKIFVTSYENHPWETLFI